MKGIVGMGQSHQGHSDGVWGELTFPGLYSWRDTTAQPDVPGVCELFPVLLKVFKHMFSHIIYQDSYDF